MNPPEPFVWESREKSEVRCSECGEVMSAVTIDLHMCPEA